MPVFRNPATYAAYNRRIAESLRKNSNTTEEHVASFVASSQRRKRTVVSGLKFVHKGRLRYLPSFLRKVFYRR